MSEVLYEFKNIYKRTQSNYIFQYVKNRKLTDIYHSHDFYEIIYFLQGKATQLVNGKEISFVPNSIILMRPHDKHCFLKQSENIVIVSLSVQSDEFELLSNTYNTSLKSRITNGADPKMYSISHLLPYTSTDFEKLTSNEKEHEFKFLLFCFFKSFIDSIEEKDSVPKMLAYAISEMKKTENLRVGIKAFTAISNYSQSHLSRLIKKFFNLPLKQYINELRLQKAYNCIVFTQNSFEDIADELGFVSYSHFNKIFKTRFYITPGALRKEKGIWTA